MNVMETARHSLNLVSSSGLPLASHSRRFARFILCILVGLPAMLHGGYTSAQCIGLYPSCGFCLTGIVAFRYLGTCFSCGRNCRPVAPGTAQAVAAALGPDVAEARGNTVFLKTDQAPHVGGVWIDLDSLKQLSTTHAAVAIVLLSFHPDFFHPDLNMLRGVAASAGMPTQQSFQLALQRAPDETIEASFAAVQPGTFVQVRWDSRQPNSDTLEVTFNTEEIDESASVKRVLASPVNVLVSRKQQKVLSVAPR